MAAWVALLRGVNVGGVKIEMARLRRAAEALGWADVRSYIASGNLVFSAEGRPEALATALQAAIEAEFGRPVEVLVLSKSQMTQAAAACPFAVEKGNQAHCFFCWAAPVIDTAKRDALIAPTEQLVADGLRVWMHHPEGLGRSKLGDKIGTIITGTPFTGRNLNTVAHLAEMLDETAAA